MSEECSGFQELLEVSNTFDICQANPEKNFEAIVEAKTRDLTLLSSRSKLLQAACSINANTSEQPPDNALKDYGDEITLKLLEKMTVKAFSQGHVVKALLNAPNETLDPEVIKMKQNILESLSEYHNAENQLRKYEKCLREREAEHATARAEWDKILGTLKAKINEHGNKAVDTTHPLYRKLQRKSKKLELMKWLVVRFMKSPTTYDWLEDPKNLFAAVLKVTKMDFSVEKLFQDIVQAN